MILLKPYINIKGFINRFTILKIGKLHIRLHRIIDKDRTTLYHNHPFNYLSIILSGGYNEIIYDGKKYTPKKHRLLSFIFRRNNIFHRIESIIKPTLTLFIAYGDYGWKAINSELTESNTLQQRVIGSELLWSKKKMVYGLLDIKKKKKRY